MYEIVYHESVRDDLKKNTKTDVVKIKTAIEKKLMHDPVIFGEPLRSSLVGHRKLRVGNYRIVYRIEPIKKTIVIIIAHRREVYKKARKRLS